MRRKNIILFCLWGTCILGMQAFLKENYAFYLKWYFVLLLAGTIFYPISMHLFQNFKDKGWNFSKVLGFVIPGITFWFLSYQSIEIRLN